MISCSWEDLSGLELSLQYLTEPDTAAVNGEKSMAVAYLLFIVSLLTMC